jgi:hypothetical protein
MRPNPSLPAAALLSAVVLTLAGCGGASPDPSTGAISAPRVSRVTLAEAYKLFRGPSRPPTPAVVRQLSKLGLKSDQAYRSSTANGNLWAVNNGHVVCILAGRPLAIGCEPAAKAQAQGVTLGIVSHPGDSGLDLKRKFTLYGIVPDSQPTVRVLVGQRHRIVRVKDNSYSLEAREPVVREPG